MYLGSLKGQLSPNKHTPTNQQQKLQTNKMKQKPSPTTSYRWQVICSSEMYCSYKLQAPQNKKPIKSQQHNIFAVLQL